MGLYFNDIISHNRRNYMKVLLATDKPFAKEAVEGIKKVFAAANYELTLLEKYAAQKDFENAVADCNAIIIRSDKVTKEVIQNAPNLKIVVRAGAGYDNVDLQAASEKNVVVMNTPGQNSNAVAELAFGMMIYIARVFFSGKSGTELKGKSLGIHAYGNVGKCVAQIAKGFQMKVYAFDPFVAVSYTHLTLPTILLVQISVVAVSLKKKKKKKIKIKRDQNNRTIYQ
eukprot:TRINITY_DN27625_c0_g1_i1.p1 TRINITY_DN27625_c0_g1~~TRINITY_DN27625_c0_g1_i1.p1  ORF type:complete len:227 (-),score=61.63 TRINITY_DN27625_c0_g1_i1:54-734(-)